MIGDEAVRLIEKQDKNKPFFLYFASLAPHAPYQAPKADEDRYASTIKDPTRRTYAAMITSLDDQVGRIVAALEKRGLRENTLIIFSQRQRRTAQRGGCERRALHGGARRASGVEQESLPASNGDLRGGKGSLHEGGVRVPTIFNWPAKLKPRVVNEPLHMVDIMPTVLALAGAKANRRQAARRQGHLATVAEGKPSPHDDILVNVEAFRGAIIKGKWKLVKIALLPGKTELFDLAADPGEKNDVAAQNPEVVRDLEARLIAYAKQQKMSEWMKAQPDYLGAQGKTVFDPDFDIDDGGLPHQKTGAAQEVNSVLSGHKADDSVIHDESCGAWRIARSCCFAAVLCPGYAAQGAAAPTDGSVLPFPPTPSASVAAPTLQDSKHQRRVETEPPAEGRAQHPHHPAGRRRLRPARHLRRPDPHADAHRASPTRASATTPSTPRRSARRRARRC